MNSSSVSSIIGFLFAITKISSFDINVFMEKTPITIISGYLGSGKTTLLRNIIKNLDKKFAILMNEFGEVSIDSQIIKGKNVDVQELSGGCVCCSLTGEFEAAIKEIKEKYSPEIIIMETTGVAEPDSIVFDLEGFPEAKLDSVIIVLDADSFLRFPNVGRIGEAQIGVADIVLLNKIDLVGKKEIVEIEDKIKRINPRAFIFKTSYCEVDVDLLFSSGIEKQVKIKKYLHHENKLESFVVDSGNKNFKKAELENFLKTLPKEVYRMKGFVNLEGKSTLVNFVAGRWALEQMDGEKKIVFIGENISNFKNMIKNSL